MKRRLTPGPGEPKESIEHWSDEELMIVYAQGADSSEEAFRLLYGVTLIEFTVSWPASSGIVHSRMTLTKPPFLSCT